MGFERLVYTDCLPGESLSGRAGFGFRAASDGAGPVVQETVARQLLYEAPEEWMQRERPVADYPPMLAHLHRGDWYCTALGAYLGRERKGNRQGNHLTEAACTRDPADYRGLRPAQLATAAFWLRADPGRSDLRPVTGAWDFTGPTADDAFAAVRADPHWRRRLAVALTVLNDAESDGRLVLVGDDLAEILRWITAATLLMPRDRALATGFKAFTTRPHFGDFAIIAVRPRTATGLQLSGSAVLDLADGDDHGPDPDPVAQTWVDHLDELDHLDLADAIELAGDSGLAPAAAQDLALAAFADRPVAPASAGLVAAWLAECPPERYRAYAAPVTDALLALADRPHALLVELDRLALRGRLTTGSAAIRLELVAEELRSAQYGSPVATAPIDPLARTAWTAEDDRAATALLLDMLATGQPAALDAVLRVADRFGLARVDLRGEAPVALDRFFPAWERLPRLEVRSSYRDELRQGLLDHLDRRHGADPAALARAARDWHRQILDWFSPPPVRSPAYRACLAEAGAASDAALEQRLSVLLRTVAPEQLSLAAAALFGRCAVSPWTMRRLLDARPADPFGPVLVARLLQPDLDGSEPGAALENLRLAHGRGLCPDAPEVAAVVAAAADARVRTLTQAQLQLLYEEAPWLIGHLGETIAPAVLGFASTAWAVAVMRHGTPGANSAIAAALGERLKNDSWTAPQFALALALAERKDAPHRRQIAKHLKEIAEDMPGRTACRVADALRDRPEWRAALVRQLDQAGNDRAVQALLRRQA